MTYSYSSNKSNVREFLSYSSFCDTCNRFTSHMFTVDCLKIPSWDLIRFGWPRDHFVLKIQSEFCHPKCARRVSELSRKGPRLTRTTYWGRFSATFFGLKNFRSFATKHNPLFNGSFQNLSFLQECAQRDWLTNVILCMRTAVNTSFRESKLALAGCRENED